MSFQTSAAFCNEAAARRIIDPRVERLVDAARKSGLARSRPWRKLLFIPDRRIETDESLVDDPDFFLSPQGRTDPEAELEATIRAFADASTGGSPSNGKHPQCRFPARLALLRESLGPAMDVIPRLGCSELETFLSALKYQAVSLVFSNYDPSNPGSMFGHTFLRLHRDLEGHQVALLDDIANFSAFVPDEGSLIYPIKGLLGGYRGKFALMPYYRKIQEYSNYESRDLWEYRLHLDLEEIRRLELVLWEVGGVYIDYFYFDDNCSFVMLQLLEAAKPSLALTGSLYTYAIPSDTVRVAWRAPGLVASVNVRPSALSRFVSLYSELDAGERNATQQVIGTKSLESPLFLSLDGPARVRVIDAVLEYIDYEEKLAGDRKPVIFPDLRARLLTLRAASRHRQEERRLKPLSTPPHLGHDASYWETSAGAFSRRTGDYEPFGRFTWKPALHELLSPSEGYSDELQIGMFETVMEVRQRDQLAVELKSARFFEITALPRQMPFVDRGAWRIDSGYESGIGFGKGLDARRGMFAYGRGKALWLADERILAYGLLHADLGYAVGRLHGGHGGPTLLVALAMKRGLMTLLSEATLARRYFLDGSLVDDRRVEISFAHSLNVATDLRVKGTFGASGRSIILGMARYY